MYMENMKVFRLRLGLSQKELADKVDVSEASISNYETGKREPDFQTLCALADLFGCSLDVLIRGKEKTLSKERAMQEAINRLDALDMETLQEVFYYAQYLLSRKAREQQKGQAASDSQ